jgi:hypothetical protein
MKSMTGLATAQGGATDGPRWYWDLGSVNSKGLDVRLCWPAGRDGRAMEWRKHRAPHRAHCWLLLCAHVVLIQKFDAIFIKNRRLCHNFRIKTQRLRYIIQYAKRRNHGLPITIAGFLGVTLCYKSPDAMLTRIGLSLKTTIDQRREQTANVA